MKKYFNLIIVFFAAILLFLGFSVFKNYENFSLLRREISIKEDDLQSQEEYFNKIQDISDKLKENKDLLDKIESALPPRPETPELLAFIQKSASQSNLVLEDINLGLMSSEKIKKTKINFILTGDYVGLKKFISLIENSSRLIGIDSIYFAYPEEGESFKFNLKISAYSY
jgi:Tfp pilus assembly protein PilO